MQPQMFTLVRLHLLARTVLYRNFHKMFAYYRTFKTPIITDKASAQAIEQKTNKHYHLRSNRKLRAQSSSHHIRYLKPTLASRL